MDPQQVDFSDASRAEKTLDDIGWGIFLIMIGTLWLVPKGSVPEGTWLIGTGVLLLMLNAVRYLKGIPLSGFTTILGMVALAAGLVGALGMTVPLFAICLVVAGAYLVLRPLMRQRV